MSSLSASEKQYQKMIYSPIPKLVTSLAVPAMISNIITILYNTADTFFVSQINESASAAVGVVYSIMAVLQAVGYGLGMGSSSLVSRLLGKKQNQDANVIASSSFYFSISAGLLVGVLCLSVLEPLLKLIGASETMLPYAIPYARIILLAAPLSCSSFVLSALLRSEGNAKLCMWSSLASSVLNIILDPILIFSLDMGSGGAALATIISQIVNWGILFYVYVSGKSIVKLHFQYISKSWKTYKTVIITGSPTILRQGLGSLSATALNVSAVVYGDATVAAITIAGKVYTLVRQLIMGIGSGFQPVSGYNYGAGQKKRAFGAFRFSVFAGSVICTAAAIIIAFTAEPIIRWFNDSPDVVRIGTQTLLISCAAMPFLAFSTYVNQLYQCLGFAKIANLLASCRQGTFFMPIILILPRIIGVLGVQVTQSLSDVLTFCVCLPFAIRFYRREIMGSTETQNHL